MTKISLFILFLKLYCTEMPKSILGCAEKIPYIQYTFLKACSDDLGDHLSFKRNKDTFRIALKFELFQKIL